MSLSLVVRRTALVAFFAAAAAANPIAPAAARGAGHGGVAVDVRPLLGNSGEPTAGWVAQELPGALAAALAASSGGGTPVSVRIDYVVLGPNSGGAGPAGSSPDQMIGAVTRAGVTHDLRATSSYYPMAQDNTMIAQSNHERVSRLVRVFADWVARGY